MRTDGQTDTTKLTVALLNFAKEPKIQFVSHREHSVLPLQRPIGEGCTGRKSVFILRII